MGVDPISPLDVALLRFAGEQRLFLAAQAAAWLGTEGSEVAERLGGLGERGLLRRHDVFHGQPAAFTSTAAGLSAIGTRLTAPRMGVGAYRHDIGVTWLWIAARRGAFGGVRSVVSERRIRSREHALNSGAQSDGSDAGMAVRLGGAGPGGRPRLHYPDLALQQRDGSWTAIELELTSKGATRLRSILRGYAGEPRYERVMYLAGDARLAGSIADEVRRLGLEQIVRVQPAAWRGPVPGVGAGGRLAGATVAGARRGRAAMDVER